MNRLEKFEADLSGLQALSVSGLESFPGEASKVLSAYADWVPGNLDQVIAKAGEAFNRGEIVVAEQVCRFVVRTVGNEIRSLHLLSAIASRVGNHEDAVDLLLDCVDLNPGVPFIRFDLASALFKSSRFELALEQCNRLLELPKISSTWPILKAACLVQLGRYDEALTVYEQTLERKPDDPGVLLRYGIALRIQGRGDESMSVFRKVLSIDPKNGEAYYNIANMKTHQFSDADIESMTQIVASEDLGALSRIYLQFALGKAMNDRGDIDRAFEYYAGANTSMKRMGRYNPDEVSQFVARCKNVFSSDYFDAPVRGCDSPDPIFIVGLARSGSTLLEQILGCHSAVDATRELPEFSAIVRSLNNPQRTGLSTGYPEVIREIGNEGLAALGQEYINRTRCFRRGGAFFIDKALPNFMHIGLIASVLPNAKIIDVRRDPHACGWSIYTQYFSQGAMYAYDLEHIGRYYRDYLAMMDHWNTVLPGKVLTVNYEDVVIDLEGQVRRVLGHCDLQFEEACLEFHKSTRPVSTVSSEQVRQPIYGSSVDHWKQYAKYLTPLKTGLEGSQS